MSSSNDSGSDVGNDDVCENDGVMILLVLWEVGELKM